MLSTYGDKTMKQLEKAIKLLLKNYMIILPLFAAIVIPAIIEGGDVLLPGFIRVMKYFRTPENIKVMPTVLSMLKTFFSARSTGVLGFIFQFIAMPAAIGMLLKSLGGGQAGPEDIAPSIKGCLKQYMIYWAGSFTVSLSLSFASIMIGLLISVLTLAFSGFRIFLLVILYLVMVLVRALVVILLSLWLPAMFVDNLKILDAAKKSIELMKHSFISILKVYLAVNITAGILQVLIRVCFGWIPVFGDISGSLLPAAASALLLTYYFIEYRRAVGKEEQIIRNPEDLY